MARTINRVVLYNRGPGNIHRLNVDALARFVSAVIAEYQERRTAGMRPHGEAVQATVEAARDWKFTITDSAEVAP